MESNTRALAREGACIADTVAATTIMLRRDNKPFCPHATESAPRGCASLGIATDQGADDSVGATSVDVIYCAGAAGTPCWARNHRGDVRELPMRRWFGSSGASAADRLADNVVVAECSGRPTLDLGCGPGRFTGWLQRDGAAALGVDASAVAVAFTRRRGGTAMRRDLFGPLPAEGCWDNVLLADGNIGIGGDPVRTLNRAADLLAPGGAIIVELENPEVAVSYEMLRWETEYAAGHWFPWARVGAPVLGALADAAGLRVNKIVDMDPRVVAVLGAGSHPSKA
ncbi:class I SAM-dependent methyltransferase [Mycobacterium simiae]|uniref:class I SAM-dependent methyltransferase n=2 Tax=Mycobacterium simiae TaxID=1784 RepID=UPI002F2B444D